MVHWDSASRNAFAPRDDAPRTRALTCWITVSAGTPWSRIDRVYATTASRAAAIRAPRSVRGSSGLPETASIARQTASRIRTNLGLASAGNWVMVSDSIDIRSPFRIVTASAKS